MIQITDVSRGEREEGAGAGGCVWALNLRLAITGAIGAEAQVQPRRICQNKDAGYSIRIGVFIGP